MAKKQVQVIEVDVITKGLNTAENSFKTMTENTGDLGKKSKEILKDIGKARSLMEKYGDEMPIDEARELQKILERIGNNADDISAMDSIKVFGDKEIEKIKKINSQLDEYNKKIKEQEQLQKDLAAKRDERIEKLKTQKTANLTQSDGTKKSVKLDSIQGKWNTKEDLDKLSTTGTAEEQEAAKAVLEQMSKAQEQYTKALDESVKKVTSYKNTISDLKVAKAEIAVTTRELTDAEKFAGESTAMFAQTQASQLGKIIESNQKLGNSAIDTSNKLKKQQASLGGVVKSLFSWTAAWNIGKKLYREAIRTINEMDKSLTGMAMVTGQSREEVDALIPRIQKLAKETSTAMTEIAGLITEYTKQGRTLEESFILAEETAKAAKIAGISAAESIQYMTSAINGFNLAAKDATRVSDIFANLAAISATDYEQLAISLSKVSAQANTAGMSIEYTTALLAKGIETTQEAPESIGTALKTILARMRELSDYGKTLEDGGSVNKVENALASAGIELRDVNGQFRDLETIFNELGPKWDELNTMQQQAIAQAVAGTRQQSRFVAIMQDWQRTQELAAEAQDSAGASAAQYAVYAQGMEAAMTNLKTSWQEFIQSITSSKFIIGVVNTVTSLLEGVTSFLDQGGEFTKAVFISLVAIVGVNKTLESIRKALGIETDKEKMNQIELLKLEKEKYELEQKQLQNKQAQIEAEIKAKELALAEKEKHMMDPSEGMVYSDGEDVGEMYTPAQIEDERKKTAEEILALENQITALKKQQDVAANNATDAQTAYSNALLAQNAPLASRTQAMIDELSIQKQAIDNEKERLKLMLAQAEAERATLKDGKEIAKADQKINKLKQSIAKSEQRSSNLGTRINNLETKKKKILTNNNKLYTAMDTTIGNSMTRGLTNVLNKLNSMATLLVAPIHALAAQAAMQKVVNAEKAKAAKLDNAALVARTNELLAQYVSQEIEEEKKEEMAAQIKILLAEQVARGIITGAQAAEILNEKLIGIEKKNNLLLTLKESATQLIGTFIAAAKSAAQIPYIGWIIAAGILAAAGLGAGIMAAKSAGENSDVAKEDKIAAQQNTIYNTKKKNNELKISTDELDTLLNKDIRTQEEEDRIKELADGLREENEAWANLSDTQVLEEAKKEMAKNNDIIARNIDSNYELASSMEDLSGSIAQQAIVAKMSKDQEKLIASKAKSGANTEEIAKNAAAMAETFVEKNAEDLSKIIKTDEVSGWEHVSNILGPGIGIDQWADGIAAFSSGEENAFWKGMDELLLNGLVSKVSEYGYIEGRLRSIPALEMAAGVLDDIKAKQERDNFDDIIKDANNKLVDFAVAMEASGDDLADQLKTYNKLMTEEANAMVKNSAASQYSTLDILSKVTSKSDRVAESFGNLTKAGLLSSEALLKIVDAASEVQNSNDEKIKQGLDAYQNGVVGSSTDGKKKVTADLDALRKEFNLGEDATVNEIKEAYLKKYAKFGADGNIQYDTNNNIKMKGNNANKTAVYNALNELSGSLGDLADLTESQLKSLSKYKIDVDLEKNISELLQGVNDSLGLTGKSDEELKALQNDAKFQATASSEIIKQGFDMIESMTGDTKNYIETEQNRIAGLREAYNKLDPESGKAAKILKEINAANQDLAPILDNYNSSLAKLTQSTLNAAGYLDNAAGDELLTRAESTRSRISDIREKVGSGEALEAEDFAFIRDDLAPQLQELYGEDFDLNQFYKDLAEGNGKAFEMLDRAYASQEALTNIDYEKSIASKLGLIQEYQEDINSGDLTEEQIEEKLRLIAEEKKSIATQKAEQEQVSKLMSEQLGLSAEELKLQNARNKLSALEADTTKNIVEKYNEKLSAQKVLLNNLMESMNNKWDTLSSRLNNLSKEEIKNLKEYIKIENGVIDIHEEWYNNLDGYTKEIIDEWVEGASETASEIHDMYNQMSEDAIDYYETQIDQQSQLLDAYKNKLENEQEALQESLDKRKEMYEKYFNALNNEAEDENFEEEQARLQRAIASLSTATDATSLTKLKEYQEQLQDLEDEQRQTERDRRREATMEGLDNQSEAVDQYYEDRLENEQVLWNEISRMSEEEITSLMTTYNDEYKNATDLNKQYMLLSYKELHANIMAMMGDTDAANKAKSDLANYKKYMELYASDPTIGEYDPKKSYSKGGLVDYTGLAMVHGSSSQPEAFLNANQTALFSKLASNLELFYTKASPYANNDANHSNNVVIENFTVAVDATLTDHNVQQTGESLADALLEGLRRTGISVNMKK